MNENRNIVLVAVGSNATSRAGGAQATVEAAIFTLREKFINVSVSSLYRTPAFPAGSGPDFVNAACAFHSDQGPHEILDILHSIEADFGRQRGVRWGQRTLDLDLIGYGQTVLPDPQTFDHWRSLPPDQQQTDAPDQLILPHPRVQDRPFVLVPLADVAADWCHPVLGIAVAEMLAAHPPAARAEVTPIS